MLRGLYTAASGMLATSIVTDTLANNLANVNTVGFKSNKVNYQSFPEMLLSRISDQGTAPIGSVMTGSHIYESFTNHAAGSMRETGNTFDMAVEGDGFFTIKKPNGEIYYTRAGNFTINPAGYLTTLNGDYVQGNLGNIQINLDQGPFTISRQGDLAGKDKTIDRLKIARFTDNQTLLKVGDNTYQKSNASQELPVPPSGANLDYTIHQGVLEMSNVNPIAELVNNIQGVRLYEALQKNITLHNEALQKTVNEVGRIK